MLVGRATTVLAATEMVASTVVKRMMTMDCVAQKRSKRVCIVWVWFKSLRSELERCVIC
jgi:hypothetical protein